jgi:tetratricopeptide (TPR) repeat protein
MKQDLPIDAVARGKMLILQAVLVAVTVAAYWQVAHNGFINLDDWAYIVANPHVNTGLSWDNVKWAFTTDYAGNWHPLTWISHMLDVQLFGLDPAGHHLANLAFHIANTLLLFWFLMRTTARFWASVFVAGLFALHPLHVESVAWASERKDTLSTFFWMATMLMYVSYARKPGIFRYLCVAVLLALGLMAKQMLVTLPFVLLFLDYWPLERFSVERWRLRSVTGLSMARIIIEKVPLIALSAGASVVTILVQSIAPTQMVPFIIRLLNAIISYGRYLWKMVWPVDLSVLYYFFHTPTVMHAAPVLLFLLAATAAAVVIGRRHRYVIVGWLWYTATLVPVIGLVHVGYQSHADRYTYIPLTGIFIIIAYGLDEIAAARPSLRRHFVVAGTVILAACAIAARQTVGYWKDDRTLFGRAISTMPENALARLIFARSLNNQGDYDEANSQLLISLAIRPTFDTLYLLGKVARCQGLPDQALDYFKRAIDAGPQTSTVFVDSGEVLLELRRYAEAAQYYKEAVQLDPTSAELHALLGMALGQAGQLEEGMNECREAIRLKSDCAPAYRIIAAILAKKGDYSGAAEQYSKSLVIEQDFSAWNNLGDAQENLGELDAAKESYRKAIAMDSASAVAHYNLGSVLNKLDRRDEAIAEAAKAMDIDPNYAAARTLYRQLKEGRH